MRAKKINVKIFSGIEHKERMLDKICQQHSINYQNVCYIGDDVNDLEIMKKVGFSATPKDGVKEVKRKSTFISTKLGGEGVLREVADLIIRVKR